MVRASHWSSEGYRLYTYATFTQNDYIYVSFQTMKHSTSKYGENLYASVNPADIDKICEYAMIAWFREYKKYDFNNPKFSEKTGMVLRHFQ